MSKGHLKFATFILFALALSVLSLLPYKASASSASSVLVNMFPTDPGPGETTTINLSSYANNLDSILISWSVNGKKSSSGVGKKSFSLSAPAAGIETDVIASISFPDGAADIKIIIRPATLVMLWQANDSYVPPFYRGKALPTADSEIKVVAMPEIKTGSKFINPATMVYAWKKDYNSDQGSSGYGKNFFVYSSDYLDTSNIIGVTASTTDQNYSSEENTTITTSQPKILFYKNDPVLGTLWEKAVTDGYQIKDSEILSGTPYFVSPADIRIPTLVFNWFINDTMVAVADFKKNLLALAVQAGTSGASKIRLEISNTDKIFENASKEITVQF